jgi:DNA modification methylase
MDGERAVLCVADPPYMVNYDPQWRVGLGGGGTQRFANGEIIQNDDNLSWLGVFNNLPTDVLYCWTADRTIKELQIEIERCGFALAYLIIWNKDTAVFGRGDYHYKYEPCLYMVRKGKNHNWQGDRKQETVWDIPTINSFANGHNSKEWGLVGHGNQKPLECMERPIRNNSKSGEIVIDPFLGSGTTLIACENLSRQCRGVEIEPKYVAVTLQRWADLTGEQPQLTSR